MNRVLVIAYYIPPLGLSGVMRVTKLCKYLPESGWEPVIITVKPVAYYGYDPELLGDLRQSVIIRTESLDLNRLLEIVRPRSGGRSGTVPVRSGSRWARRLNFVLLPDAKIGWLPFALRAGRRALAEYQPRVIFATAPPWTTLLAGVRLARESGLPLVADFRDPWPAGFTEPPFYQRPVLRRMLRRIVETAAVVLVVNPGTGERLRQALGDDAGLEAKLAVLENGFDPQELAVEPERLEGFSLLYAGNLYENRQEIAALVSALQAVPEVRLYLAGDADPASRGLLASSGQAVLLGRVSHRRAVALMKGADALLYLGKPKQPVGLKLYEYLGVKRPVIVWGSPDDEAARLVAEFGAGKICQTGAELAAAVAAIRENPAQFTSRDRQRLDRRFQARRLAGIFQRLSAG
ncbi:MAG: glycosyltransferase [candidate division WOR-3 bacterium]